jgi:hypothetical protein
MGSTSSKLKKFIENNDESAAVDFFKRSVKPNKFNGNVPVNESLDTFVHLCAFYGMQTLLK